MRARKIKYPFFLAITVSSAIYCETKLFDYYTEKRDSKIEISNEEQSSIDLVEADDTDISSEATKETSVLSKEDKKEPESISDTETTNSEVASSEPQSEVTSEVVTEQNEPISSEEVVTAPTSSTQEVVTEPPKAPDCQFATVDLSYLDGALFIGDSRTATLYEYAGWQNTTFYVEYGLSIWSVLDKELATNPSTGEKISVYDGLSLTKYDKIYIMLGINELGTGTADTYYEQFKSVIDTIRMLQPDATIFIQSIMHVTDEVDKKGSYINNNEINARNAKLVTLVNNIDTFYIDNNELFDDPSTYKLDPIYTSDGVHIMARYVGIWQDFYLQHGIIR